jgi:ribosomal protein L37AE/L43A
MEKERLEEIKAKLRELREDFKNAEPKYPYDLFGIECGEGWKHLYQPIIDKVIEYNKDKDEDSKIVIHQIKEKFGSLRIYLSKYTDELSRMIDDAEEKSYHTCEVCGKYIEEPIVENYWIYAECKDCHEEWHRKQNTLMNKIKEKEEKSESSKDKS